jgi:hypothetical protein
MSRPVVLLLLAGALLAAAAPARANGAVDRLTLFERQHLERHFPGWGELAAERRERIARNVIELRGLTPEEKARLSARVKEAEARRLDPERLERVRAHLADPKARWKIQALVAAALARVMGEVVAADALPTGPDGRALPPAVVGLAFYRALEVRIAKDEGDEGRAREYEPTAEGRARYREIAARSDPDGARELRRFVLEDRVRRAVKEAIDAATPQTPPAFEGVVATIRAAYPVAFEALLAEARRADRETMTRFFERFGPKETRDERTPRRFEVRRAAMSYLQFLQQAGPWLLEDPARRARAEHLLEALFRQGMGVPETTWARLPGWDRPSERFVFLKRLLWERNGGGPPLR